MGRKITKKGIKRKLDKLVSEIVRSRGYCVKCGKDDYTKLQACHIFSRKLMSVRFDLDNILCLCASCHSRFHDRPTLFTLFVQDYLGELKFVALHNKAKSIKKWTLGELEELYKTLKEAK